MSSTQHLLAEHADDMFNAMSKFDKEVTDTMSIPGAIDNTIAQVWPTRRRRITHDMVAVNFNSLVSELLVYMQIILVLQALEGAGRNWDHLSSIDQVFTPTFVHYGACLLIFFISFISAWFLFVSEGGDSRLLEFDELHRLWRLVFHLFPLVVKGIELLFIYSIIHCHLSNAHRGEAICEAFNLESVTVAVALLISAKIFHRILNFYQIFKHTQQPIRRRVFRSALPAASIPLLGIPASRTVRQPSGLGPTSSGASATPTIPNTAQYPDTNSSNYALPEYGTTSSNMPL